MTTSTDNTGQQNIAKVPNPIWHRRLARGYLFGCAIGSIVFVLAMVPAMPLFIKLLLPFPKLEDAHHWVGRVEVEGEFRIGLKGNTIPRHFIVTSTGRHEFKCGYIGWRYGCRNDHRLANAEGEVWYHPFFGALQWKFVINEGKRTGEIDERSIIGAEHYFLHAFNYRRYLEKLSIALVALVGVLWQYRRYRFHSDAAVATEQSSTNHQ